MDHVSGKKRLFGTLTQLILTVPNPRLYADPSKHIKIYNWIIWGNIVQQLEIRHIRSTLFPTPHPRSWRVPTLGVLGRRKNSARDGFPTAASDSRRCGRGFKARNCASISLGGNQVSKWWSDLTIKFSICKSIFVASEGMILQAEYWNINTSSMNRGVNESSHLIEFLGSVSSYLPI